MVIEMKEIRPRRKGALIGKVLRLFGKNMGFEELTIDQGEIVHAGASGDNYSVYRKEIETAWLEAQRKKAEAMKWQQRRFIY